VGLPEGESDWAPRFYARSHWLSVSANNTYAVYLAGRNIIVSRGEYKLYSTDLASPVGAGGAQRVALLHTTRLPSEWLPLIHLLPDGHTILSIVPPGPGSPRGIYSYDLQSGESIMAIPQATDMWRPGFTSISPSIPTFLGK
jgi:hypothetical protein